MSSERLDEQMAWKVGKDHYLILQTCDDGWDYTLYDKNFKELDGGQLDMPELSMQEARSEILNDFDLGNEDLLVVGYDEIVERAEVVERKRMEEYEVDNLAHDLDQFGYDYDPFGYGDNYTSREDGFNDIRKGLLEGKTEGIKVFLQDIIGDDDTKNAIFASDLCSRIEAYERKHFPKEPVQKEEKHSVLQELNNLKVDAGERPELPTKSREEVR